MPYPEAPKEEISIHAPRTGSDGARFPLQKISKKFQSTLPARGATCPLPARCQIQTISIHAPRTGSAPPVSSGRGVCRVDFNPRSPHGERLSRRTSTRKQFLFQSTLPARGATRSTRTMCCLSRISIHAPRTGSDGGGCVPSAGSQISIHAPRTGSDKALFADAVSSSNFNPRSPHGERQQEALFHWAEAHFNPRSPHGERRQSHRMCRREQGDFNPRSPHGERRLWLPGRVHPCHFNPRSPHGERHGIGWLLPSGWNFNPRSPHGERLHQRRLACGLTLEISIHAPRTGSDTAIDDLMGDSPAFQSTLPARGATNKHSTSSADSC